MVGYLNALLAKGTKPTIGPTTLWQSLRRLKSILQSKPSMVLKLWRSPSLSNKACIWERQDHFFRFSWIQSENSESPVVTFSV
jgi:hypothetical protein